jgi:hypothetical protein
LLQPLQIP